MWVMVDTEVMEVMVIARERWKLSQVTEAMVMVDMEAMKVMVDTEAEADAEPSYRSYAYSGYGRLWL